MNTTMNTTTKTAAAPARNALKVRTAVRAGYSWSASQAGNYVTPRGAGYAMAEMGL